MKKRWNGFAVAGFVLAFTNCLLGLIFSCIGIGNASKYGDKGKGLAIAGLIISLLHLPTDIKDRTRETIIETYAKSEYEDIVYEKEGSKKIKKNASKGYTFTVEDMENDTPGIRELFKSCDLKKSKVTVYPSKPYGKTDYSIKTTLDCE